LYDLHAHSNYSDGILRPQAVVSRAKTQGVTALALTDHDTLGGLAEARQEALVQGIELIAGIEFSCLWNGIGIHVVGLQVDPDSRVMQEAVTSQHQARERRAETIAAKLEKAGIAGALDGARQVAGEGAVLGRPHFAKFLVAEGHCKSINAAFKRYLGAGKPGDVKQLWPSVGEAVDWIRAAGGIAVLAHPDKYKMTRTKLGRLLQEFVEAGGEAMEVVSGQQSPNTTRDMALIANRFELYASCGSDFHVPDQPWQELGGYSPLPDNCQPVWQLWSRSGMVAS
jgi:predicted metal-dependent phosphoesterase TrpH